MHKQPEVDIKLINIKKHKILLHANKASKTCLYLVLALSSR